MGYAHIANLYKDQTILLFKECWAMEKIHGTSTHVRYADGKVWYSPGGESHNRFVGLFDEKALTEAFVLLGHEKVVVYGEAYGGSQQTQAWRYGKELRFVVFDVQIGDMWLNVPDAADVTNKLGLSFVHYVRSSTDIEALNAERDAPSEQARRNGVEGDHPREGVVLRPIIELVHKTGERVCAKHKRDDERETATPRAVIDPAKLEVLAKADAIALEWVTTTRLEHVLDKLTPPVGMERTREVIAAMTEDVLREGAGEIVDSREARAAIGKRTADIFKAHLKRALESA